MISLSRHIELLLLEHDCVIVPGLGGFIANYDEAQYDGEDDSLFLPPFRTILFNQQLQMNDGLLVQSYMAAYDASYPAAYLQMEKDIEEVVYALDTNGEYMFDKIGVLKKGIDKNVAFTPAERSILTPSLYGLYSYEIRSLSNAIKARNIESALNAASAMTVRTEGGCEEMDEKNKTGGNGKPIIHWRRSLVDVSISVAAAVMLLFCFSYQALKNTASDTDTVVATFYTTNDVKAVNYTVSNKNVTTKEKANKTTKSKVSTKKAENVIEEKNLAVVPEKQEAKFTIVLASYVSKNNADIFINNLARQGFKEGRYVKDEKISRILYSNYKDKEEAQQALQELRQQSREFAEGWILEL